MDHQAGLALPCFSSCNSMPDTMQALHDPFPSAGSSSSGSLGASLMYPLSMLLSGASLTSAALASPSDRYQPPPRVEAWVGTSPKSFPLQMQHSGM
jgi:hypothetical protein